MSIKSYSPTVNKLILKSINTYNDNYSENYFLNNFYKLYNNKLLHKILLSKLKKNKINYPERLIAPKQLYSNCWFNTMFTVFFFSDKGRKFFKYFRYLMITGEKYENNIKVDINNNELKEILFILNIFIEASLNQKNNIKKNEDSKTLKKSKIKPKTHKKTNKNVRNLYNKLLEKILKTNNLNTNFFIENIYNIISKKNIKTSIPKIKDAGNPIEYYKKIINYLDDSKINLMEIDIVNNENENIKDLLENKIKYQEKFPHIIIINDFESNNIFDLNYNFGEIDYNLDAVILTNKDHFLENTNSHFVSLLTINNNEYKFDGSSLNKLSLFDWKKIINKDKDWGFIENPNYYKNKYNFTKGYKILFYYKDN